MTITIYELLRLIKDGKAPKKIKYENFYCYYDEEKNEYVDYAGVPFFKWDYIVMNSLNNTVEIIEEENKIEKLKWNVKSQHNCTTDKTQATLTQLLSRTEQLKKSLNELIDEINKIKEDK